MTRIRTYERRAFMLTRVVLLITVMVTQGQAQQPQQDPISFGKPLSYWIASIQSRDEQMDHAFYAIMSLGPEAAPAIPELTKIVLEPFRPVRVGVDDKNVVADKLIDMDIHVSAINALAAIGAEAVASAPALIRWALTPRVIVEKIESEADRHLFVEMITIDVAERMRVAGLISSFGVKAAPAIHSLLTKGDSEGRKLAVAILSDAALPIIAELLKSRKCEDRQLGVEMLLHMWPVVAKEHLIELKKTTECISDSF
jgi:hypothetical protein